MIVNVFGNGLSGLIAAHAVNMAGHTPQILNSTRWQTDMHEPVLRGNRRMAQPLAGLRRLADREQVVQQERERDPFA